MPPKKFEGKFGIAPSHSVESELTSALYRLPNSISLEYIEKLTEEIVGKVNKRLEDVYEEKILNQNEDNSSTAVIRSLSEDQIKTLHLKLARHFEDNGDSAKIDISTCVDALAESSRFLDNIKGSMEKLFEIHEVKTLQKIAEIRRKRAELNGNEIYNPYENLFETVNGKYYMARLLNMPHLEQESQYMDHCVGTSTSYVNKIKRGEVEILSFRDKITSRPFVTIEYDLKSKRLLQIKLMSDEIPKLLDGLSSDLLEAIERLSTTINNQGETRVIEGNLINDSKTLLSLKEKTDKGEDFTREELLFLYEVNSKIECFDSGRDPLIKELLSKRNRKEDIQTLCDCPPEFISTDFININESTQVFCEDTKDKITFFDFREEKNKKKLPQLIELAKSIKESGSPARPDMSFEGGIVNIEIDKEKLKDLPTALQSYKEADNNSPSYIWDELNKMPFTTTESQSLDVIILSYNLDSKTRESSDKIVADMDKLNLRPALFGELITLGIVKPEFNKRSNEYLVGLGTKASLGGGVYVPDLSWSGGKRGLRRDGWAVEWSGGRRFVCVRK